MNRIVLFMARYRLLWLLWLSLGTPFVLLSFSLSVLAETFRAFYGAIRNLHAMWNWTWKHDLQVYLSAFSEQHRQAQRSLGRKPATGGMWMRS